jgi:hypothetical protein
VISTETFSSVAIEALPLESAMRGAWRRSACYGEREVNAHLGEA